MITRRPRCQHCRRRIVDLSRHGVRDPAHLTAYALASIDSELLIKQLETARSDFETKALLQQQIRQRCESLRGSDAAPLQALLAVATEEVTAAKSRYVELLMLRSDVP